MEHENKGLATTPHAAPLPKPVEKPHQRPAWMTAEWLAEAASWTGSERTPALAREILHLDAELAERTRELARWQAAPPWKAALAQAEAERDAARAASEEARRVWNADEEAAIAMGKPAKMTLTQWVREFAARESRAKAALDRVVEIIDGSDGGIRASAADEARPEPAAEPFAPVAYEGESFAEVLGSVDESLSHVAAVNGDDAFRGAVTGCLHYLRDAVEVLAREVRR
jgi:hypothetical protein